MSLRVFVIGASGAIGRPAVDRLLEAGHDVSALAHQGARVVAAGVRPVPGSLFDVDTLCSALAGQEVVVNLATRIPSGADAVKPGAWRENDRIRTEGSRVLVDAALAAGVPRLIQESVTFVYPDSGDRWITEQTEPAPHPLSQAATMAAAANAVRFAEHGRIGTVLRFGQLYGPDRNSGEIRARVLAGKAAVLGKPAGWLTPLHPDDAGTAVAAALACGSGVYNVCASPVRRSDWAIALGRDAGSGMAATFYPPLLQRLAGARAEQLTRSLRVSNAAFVELTGWRPRYDRLDDGWSLT
jgi:nucleoside-diphosphate-sugar epimerase